jgi:hypothetical protein
MKYKSDVPEGVSGEWKVQKFTVSIQDEAFQKMRAMWSSSDRGRYVPAGTYTRLVRDKEVIMSDTPDEINDQRYAIYEAKGHCLINGLGLGITTELVLQKPEVEFVTVIEISKDVIKLVGDHLLRKGYGKRLNIVLADTMEYKPPKGSKFGMVWHDIWDSICEDNLEEMKKLHRRYGRLTDWQGSWGRELIRR